MNILEDIFERCHKRHGETAILRQRKTVVTTALYKRFQYRIKVHCVRSNPQTLDALENADISFMPIGHAPENDIGPRDFGGVRFLKRQKAQDWQMKQWYTSWGIQIYTGLPSELDGARWHDLEFKYNAICEAPELIATCIKSLLNTTATPLLTITKSGGLRFSCRIRDYLHPSTDEAKFFIYKHTPTAENPNHRDIFLEVRGAEGYSRWDMRYEILLGNLLEPPVIAKEVLFTPMNKLRAALHEPGTFQAISPEAVQKSGSLTLPSLGSDNLDLAKEAFLKRGFSYEREENGFHHWKYEDRYVSFWEDEEIVWVRATVPDNEFPARAVPITKIWDDTGVSMPTPLNDKILAIREGRLSPLAIKRLPQKLQQQQREPKIYKTLKERSARLERILKRDTRILALTASEADILTNTETETFLLKNHATCLNVSSRRMAEVIEERYRSKDLPSFARWRTVMYRWEQVKDIPVDIRLANPFQYGNVCEDADRFRAFQEKGGKASESICPQCPVYTECQEHGYLSQLLTLQGANAQISPIGKLFLDPRYIHLVEQTLGSTNEQDRICIIDERKTSIYDLFLECEFSKKVVEQWIVNWRGDVLGDFAVALMNALKTRDDSYSNPIGQVRAVVEAFQIHKDEIIQQMCYINIKGKVVARRTVETGTETELAHYAIDFDGGTTAVIPLDADAEERLNAMGLPFLPLDIFTRDTVGGGSGESFRIRKVHSANGIHFVDLDSRSAASTEDIAIPLLMAEAVALGILDIQNIEKINLFPTVSPHPAWTYWHQLERFFMHYRRDADAPMRWDDESLQFWMPPKLPPNIKRLLLISTYLSDQQLHRVFPAEEMDVIPIVPTAWVPGNQVFQIRTSSKSLHEILNYDFSSDVTELSKIGERYFLGIHAEIDKDPSIKHAIVTGQAILDKLEDLRAKENVCFVSHFKDLNAVDFEAVEVLWIVGTPFWPLKTFCHQAQMLFGNDEKPLNYEREMGCQEIWSDRYIDERIQGVYDQNIAGLLTHIVGYLGLNRNSGKTVMLLNDIELADITDRPETLLFDWKDFEIAGGLDRLEETVRMRERFEAERDNLTAESCREEVERVLGCSSRQANRMLQKLRGGNISRVTFREQILFLLSSSREKTTSSLVAAIDASPQAIGNELKRLLDSGEIVRVRRGVYALPENKQAAS